MGTGASSSIQAAVQETSSEDLSAALAQLAPEARGKLAKALTAVAGSGASAPPAPSPEAAGMSKTVLITGTSTGFGRLSVKDFASKGWNVIATMRTPSKETELQTLGDNVLVLELDVQKPDTITTAIAEGIKKFGKIDVLVNNAGYGSIGFFEGTSMEEVQRQFDINVFGVMRVTQAILPHFREKKAGQIVTLSSCAGLHTFPCGSVYYSSKWAIEGWAECLSYELLPLGIQIKLVEPGGYKTDFGGRSLAFAGPPENAAEYAEMAKKMQERWAAAGELPGPDPVVKTIYAAAVETDIKKMRFPIYEAEDPYGKMVALRKEQGAEAQYAAVLAASG
mmetsp:Transcript_17760/g.41351  ORF Transcript_17760/g.41351 Transcript_17760/m.41351 type:complete len:336 (+) Transcript_17760:54-1061(+)